jgi:hypothetical protein
LGIKHNPDLTATLYTGRVPLITYEDMKEYQVIEKPQVNEYDEYYYSSDEGEIIDIFN